MSIAGVAVAHSLRMSGIFKMANATLAIEMGKAITVETQGKWEAITEALSGMAVGSCGVKWDLVVWRVGEDAFIVGEQGVRKDCPPVDIVEAVYWFAWKRGLCKTGYFG